MFFLISRYWCISFTDHPGELSQTKTEPLWNKQLFTELSFLKGAIIVVIYFFQLIQIQLLSVINLIYCAKVLSNWRCQIIREMLVQ